VQEVRYRDAKDPIADSLMRTNRLVIGGWLETPELIRGEIKISNLTAVRAAKGAQLTLDEIRAYYRLNPNPPAELGRKLQTQFHKRLADPWACLVVVLVAIPFGAPSGRKGKFVGVASSIFIMFAHLVFQRLGLALGTGGHLPAVIAAWLPNILFAAAGIVLTQRVK
jgi:lipopolysaccharide export LptBFGC system permease protein LptF